MSGSGGDKAARAGDGVGDAAVIGADNIAQILGIEARRQRCRADQIAEHHGKLAPLGLARSGGGRGSSLGDGLGRLGTKGGNRRQQLASMADRRDTEFPEVVSRQLAQYPGIDGVFPERILVLLQPQTAQPVGYIHDKLRLTPARRGVLPLP